MQQLIHLSQCKEMYRYIVKYVPNIFHIAKYLIFSDDFRHILSYKKVLCVTIAIKWQNTYQHTRKNENYHFFE